MLLLSSPMETKKIFKCLQNTMTVILIIIPYWVRIIPNGDNPPTLLGLLLSIAGPEQEPLASEKALKEEIKLCTMGVCHGQIYGTLTGCRTNLLIAVSDINQNSQRLGWRYHEYSNTLWVLKAMVLKSVFFWIE